MICANEGCIMPGCGDASCNPPGPGFALTPVTGPHFTVDTVTTPGQPVVADTLTGLEWQGCVAGRSGDDCSAGAPVQSAWIEAIEYCETVDWGGHNDWRLPDPDEYVSIADYGKSLPALDDAAFPKSPSSSYWTIATYLRDAQQAWYASFVDGRVMPADKTTPSYARCVRKTAGQGAVHRFVKTFPVADQPVVSDTVTGLEWQGCAAGVSGVDCAGSVWGMSWSYAQTYCAGLDWGGQSTGWRLPDIKELSSLVDRRKSSPAIDTAAFPNAGDLMFWSETSRSYDPNYSMVVNQSQGVLGFWEKTVTGPSSRCVRK
jgi:hypothetical protein